MADKEPDVDIGSFAAPTPQDIARFEALSGAERKALIDRELQKGVESGVSEMTLEDIWAEARRRVQAKAREPDVL